MNSKVTNTDEYLESLPLWQQANLALFRELIHRVSPDITEAIKWGVPVFMLGGTTVFAMSSFKAHTKYNFICNGALLMDSKSLFNNGLESKKSRSIDMLENQTIDEAALLDLIQQATTIL